ncbi:MAG: hypothetical protein LUE64_06625, partial [Candidatus Gastranaerophilales bacterium]|nr:hypothetical protein [Candidatus Gastranaerophilales bacterium]
MKKIIITLVFAIGAFFSLPLFAMDFSSSEPQNENIEENSLDEDEDFEKEPFFEAKEKKIKKYADIS